MKKRRLTNRILGIAGIALTVLMLTTMIIFRFSIFP